MEDFQTRVVLERDELQENCRALFKFINNQHFKTLTEAEQKRLNRQQAAMELYFDILNERIDNF